MQLTVILYGRLQEIFPAIRSEESLKAKVLRGGVWLGVGSGTEQVVRFGRNIVLARLLAPESFGTMAIVMSAMTFVNTLTDIGIRDALIRHPKGEGSEYVTIAYWLSFGRAVLLAASLFLLAPWVANFYGDSQLSALLRVISLCIAIEGASSPGAFVDMKRLRFKRWAVLNHGGGICGVMVTILLSLALRNVWALVLGAFAESAARTALSFVLYPYVPLFAWSREACRELLRYSKGLFGLSFLNLVFMRADIFVLAKLFSPSDLGLYTMAVYLVQTPASFLMNLLGQTLLPTFAHIQRDAARENRILIQITSFIVILGTPTIVFLHFCGSSILGIIYGQRYSAAAGALVAAACVALLNLANGQITTVFFARGVPQLHRRSVAIMATMMIVVIYPVAKLYGLVGGQVACFLAVLVGFLFQVARIGALTGLDLGKYFRVFLVSGVMSISVPVVYLSARFFIPFTSSTVNIAFGIAGCLLAYIMTGLVLLRRRGLAQGRS